MQSGFVLRVLKVFAAVAVLAMPSGLAYGQGQIFTQMLDVLAERARQQQGGVQSQPNTSTPRLPNSTVLAVQQQLNALGYPAGTPDGVMGSGTRRAIRAWQSDLGYPPTGEITPEQIEHLTAAAPEPNMSVATGETLNLLYDTDLPLNDYRSGMDDPSLRGIGLDACTAACEVDGTCRAFTYNSKARVCFLKYAAGSAEPFSGAISGVKGAPGAVMPTVETARLLTPDEILELQQALAAAGYDVGTPDGRVGRKTRAAIADFVASNPGLATNRTDVSLLLAVTGRAPADSGPQMAFDPTAYTTLEDAQRTLTLVALAMNPDLVTPDSVIEDWLRNDARQQTGRDAAAVYESYGSANAIERKAILGRYREAVRAEAAALVPDPAAFTLRLRITGRTQLGTYAAGGLTMGMPSPDLFSSRKFDFWNSLLRTRFVGIVPGLPETYAVPAASEAEASDFLNEVSARSSNTTVDLSAFITLGGFGRDANLTGPAIAARGDVPVTVKLDRLVLYTVPGRDRATAPGGEELAVLVNTAPVGPGTSDPLIIARNFNLPLLDEHLVLPADSQADYEVSRLAQSNDYSTNLWRFFNLAVLALDPDAARDAIENENMFNLMSSTQRLRVFGDQNSNSYALNNEFERRRAREVFNEQVVPELVARAPGFPMPIVSLKRVRLGEYDFASQSFPLAYDDSERSAYRLPANFADLRPTQVFVEMPRRLPMSEREAELFIVSSQDRPSMFLATFGTLVAEGEAGRRSLRFVADRAGLYADIRLTEKLMDVDADALLPQAAKAPETLVAGVNPDWITRFDLRLHEGRLLFVPDNMPGRQGLAGLATLFALKANPTLFDQVENTMVIGQLLRFDLIPYLNTEGVQNFRGGYLNAQYGYWKGADEFEREDSRKRFIADHREKIEALLPVFPVEIATLRFASVEEFNAVQGRFPIRHNTADLTPYTGSFPTAGQLAADTEPDPSLAMGETEARAFRERLRTLTGTLLDPVVFPASNTTINPGSLGILRTYRIDGVRMDQQVQFLATPLSRKLYSLADLATPLADLPLPSAEAPEIVVATPPAEIPAPQSRFDMLGVRLGMTVAEARQLLLDRFGTRATVLEITPAWSSRCDEIQAQLDAEIGFAEGDAQKPFRDRYFDDFYMAGCATPETVVLDLAFGIDVPQQDGGSDRIVIYRAAQAGDIVGAIGRQVPEQMRAAMTNGLVDKYGSNYHGVGDDRYWVEEPAMSSNFGTSSNHAGCRPYWSDVSQVPAEFLNNNCGAFVYQDGGRVLLIDTRHTSGHAAGIVARLAQAAAAEVPEPPAKLDF